MKHIVITIRYSLLSETLKKSWNIGVKNSFDDYKKIVLSPDRIDGREKVFDLITLRSLQYLNSIMPDNVQFKVHILTSDELPIKNSSYLDEIEKKNSFIEIKRQTSTNMSLSRDFDEYIASNVKLGEIYASVRLDDDDALSVEWLEKILGYMKEEYNNKVISLCGGYAILLSKDAEYEAIRAWKWRFASAGLTYIGIRNTRNNLNIYRCGSHNLTDNNFVTILDRNADSFLRVYNGLNDSITTFPKGDDIKEKDKNNILYSKFGIKI